MSWKHFSCKTVVSHSTSSLISTTFTSKQFEQCLSLTKANDLGPSRLLTDCQRSEYI